MLRWPILNRVDALGYSTQFIVLLARTVSTSLLTPWSTLESVRSFIGRICYENVLDLVGGLSLVLLTGCAVEGGYGGGYAGVYGEYPSGYYGSAFYPGYA